MCVGKVKNIKQEILKQEKLGIILTNDQKFKFSNTCGKGKKVKNMKY